MPDQLMTEPPRSHHVVMLVRNPYTHDSRVEKEARTLVGAGHRVSIVADAARGLPARETRDGSQIHRVPRRGPPVPGLRFIVHEWRLARRLRALRPTVLHAHDTNALVPVALAAQRLGIPYVYDAHDLWLGRPRRGRSRLYFALSQFYHGLVERLLVPRARATLTVSPPIVRHLRRRYGLPVVHLVPNYPEVGPPVERRDLRDLPGGEVIHRAQPIVLYLGGLMGGRGLEQLVDAIALVPEVTLVMLGSGAEEEPLLARAAAQGASVLVLPPVAPELVEAYAASATIGVSPIVPSCLNYRYSLPNKLFQYMAAGIPVVASNFRQVREVVVGSGCGVVVDTTRPEAIARGVRGVIADPAEAAAMGARGRAAVVNRYNWDVSAQVLLGVYAEVDDHPQVG
jgi:glycosyltransferase involved in cell wall biosynthesis